jgi:hypothetical protein
VTSLVGRGRVLPSLAFERWWYGLPVAGYDPALVPPQEYDGYARSNAVQQLRFHNTSIRIGAEWLLGAK